MDVPKLDSGAMSNALVKASVAHAGVRTHIEKHAAALTKLRQEQRDGLHALNVMQHKS